MRLEVFDPPLCCPTGVCGPSVDPELVRFSADLAWLSEQGVGVERFNLAQQPQAFASNPQVAALLGESGVAALPVLLWEGEVITSGSYPSREALAVAAGLSIAAAPPVRTGLRVIRRQCDPGSGCC